MSRAQSPTAPLFDQSDHPAWPTTLSTASNSIPTSSLDPSNHDWQAFMAYDHQAPATTMPLSYLVPGQTSVGSSGAGFPINAPAHYLSPTSSLSRRSGSNAYTFIPDQTAQDFILTSPDFDTRASPFTDVSNQLAGSLDRWADNDTLLPPTSAKKRATQSPSSDASPVIRPSKSGGTQPRHKQSAATVQKKAAASTKKRKQAEENDEPLFNEDEQEPGVKKSAHNMIEKRYRNNLNDKIAALRDAVPALRIACRTSSDGDDNDAEDLEGLAPAHKLNKATVLSKATEYIHHLEKHKSRQEREISGLKARLENAERMIKSGHQVYHNPMAASNDMMFQNGVFAAAPDMAATSQSHPNGMIPVPDSMINMRQTEMAHSSYTMPHTSYPAYPTMTGTAVQTQAQQRPSSTSRNGVVGRVMMAGLTTLMVMEGYSEGQQADDNVETKDLLSLPISSFQIQKRGIANIFQDSSSANATVLRLARLMLLLASIMYIIAPLFQRRHRDPKRRVANVVKTQYSLASPVELRRQAWQTAIQTVSVPIGFLILELLAVAFKMVTVAVQKAVGSSVYAILTGTTKEQEVARHKAWRIALDAQLSGGDADINTSRLILTILASGTLPSTPVCLMLKALHIRVLFWGVTCGRGRSWIFIDFFVDRLSRIYWNDARARHHARIASGPHPPDEDHDVPEHLAKLLELDVNEVLVDPVIQRCHNLAFNKPSSAHGPQDEAMDSVVEDFCIASPLDGVAAWWSTLVVNRVMNHMIESTTPDRSDLLHDIDLALQVAPPASAARIRACVAKAVVTKHGRDKCIEAAMDMLPNAARRDKDDASPASSVADLVAEAPVSLQIATTLAIIKCLALAESRSDSGQELASCFVRQYAPLHKPDSLLALAAALQLLHHHLDAPVLPADLTDALEKLSLNLRVFVGGRSGAKLNLSDSARASAIAQLVHASKLLNGVLESPDESHNGGGSQDEDRGSVEHKLLNASSRGLHGQNT